MIPGNSGGGSQAEPSALGGRRARRSQLSSTKHGWLGTLAVGALVFTSLGGAAFATAGDSGDRENEQPTSGQAEPPDADNPVELPLDPTPGGGGPEQEDSTYSATSTFGAARSALPTPPYVTWEVMDQDGNPVAGAKFQIQGPRTGGASDGNNSNWNDQDRVVDDCVGATVDDCAIQRDKNPNPGEFLVNYIGNSNVTGALVDPANRYRVRMTTPPAGYILTDPQGWVLIPQAGGAPTDPAAGAWVDETFDFGAFNIRQVSHTITVRKGDIRTGISAANNAVNIGSYYAQGARFGLFTSLQPSAGEVPLAECTTGDPALTSGIGQCVFEDVHQFGTLYVGELDPEPGSPAANHYSAPIETLITMSDGSGPGRFTDRPYRYAVSLSATTDQAVGVPTNSGLAQNGDGQLQSSGRFMNVLDNPELDLSCEAGINVGIVIDLSSSVKGSTGHLKNAANGFINALQGTGSNVALTSFGRNSPRAGTSNTTWMSVDNPAELQTLRQTVNNYVNVVNSSGDQGTNWDIGFRTSTRPNNSGFQQPDLTIILTDGNPTYSGNASGAGTPESGAGNITAFRELERGIASANLIKDKGTRVLVYGVGRANDREDLGQNLAAISGPTAWSPGVASLNDFDYANVNWSELESMLRDVAQQVACTANVDVLKLTQVNEEDPEPADGWEFTLSKTGQQGTIVGDTTLVTGALESDDPGQASWTMKFDEHTGKADTISLAETPQDDWALKSVACTVDGNPVNGTLSGTTIKLEDGLSVGQSASCVFTNAKSTAAKLTLVKEVINEPYNGTAEATEWTLSATSGEDGISGVTQTAPVTSAVVQPGEWTLVESVTDSTNTVAKDGYDWTSLVCVDAEDEQIEAVTKDQPKLQVAAGDDITCTFTNTAGPGSVTWQKTDESGTALGGSEWTLKGPNGVDYTEFVTQDTAGTFTVSTELPWGSYVLTEVEAPAGYELQEEPITFYIGPDADANGVFVEGAFHLASDLGAQKNVQREGPALPLTGGQSAAMFAVLGLALAGAACGAAVFVWNRRAPRNRG